MSYLAGLLPCTYFPANFAVSSAVAEMNAQIASAAAAQAVSSASAAAATSAATSTVTATSATAAAKSYSAAAATAAKLASSTTAASSGTAATASAFMAVALPVAVSIVAVLAAGMVIDVACAQRELHRCHKFSVETVFSSKQQLIDALFAQCQQNQCEIYEEENGDLIVRYQLQDYFFHMNSERGCFDLEIVNAQHPQDELEKINQIQEYYMDAVRRHTCEHLMEAVEQNGWTVERDEAGEDGSQYISIIV